MIKGLMEIVERIKTSLIMPKLILGSTIFLFIMAGAMAVVLATTDPAVLLEESVGIEDTINAVLRRG